MGNPIVHFDVTGPEAELTAKFYGELFGWHVQSVPVPQGSYHLIDTHGGSGINGGIMQSLEGQPPFVTIYAEGPDIQALLDKAVKLGGKVAVPVTAMEMVTFALFIDLDGNVIGLVQSDPSQQGPGVSPGDNPPVTWFEILGPDPKRAWDFYSELFGWKVEEVSAGGFTYGQIDAGADKGIAGGIGSSQDGKGHVNVYATVDDLQKYLDRADALGGKTVVPPTEMGGVSFAQLADPQGTEFGLWSPRPSSR
jgi:predicted enzyme related to lactoylglutathione lyase